MIGIDRDRTAIAAGADLVEAASGRLTLVEERFSELDRRRAQLRPRRVDGVLLDVGVSSMQLDQAERGFSFRLDGPLDMRMGEDGPSAADVVAGIRARSRRHHLQRSARSGMPAPVARAIVGARAEAPIRHHRCAGRHRRPRRARKPGEIHPATRTFQALAHFRQRRTSMNCARPCTPPNASCARRAPGGHLVPFARGPDRQEVPRPSAGRVPAVSRHAPEARTRRADVSPATARPIVADAEEIADNPRARSAKLRAAERTSKRSLPVDNRLLPRVPHSRSPTS